MLGVGHDVQREEGDLVLGEAVLLEQRRRGLAVDARHLAFEADQQAGQGLDERLGRLHRAPALQAERLGQQLALGLRRQHLGPRHAAVLGELEQQVGMADRGEIAAADHAFFLGDVLEQELLDVPVRADGIDGGQPFGEVADVVIVLLHPLAEQGPAELARRPGLAPRMNRRMALFDGFLEGLTERTLGHGLASCRMGIT